MLSLVLLRFFHEHLDSSNGTFVMNRFHIGIRLMFDRLAPFIVSLS